MVACYLSISEAESGLFSRSRVKADGHRSQRFKTEEVEMRKQTVTYMIWTEQIT